MTLVQAPSDSQRHAYLFLYIYVGSASLYKGIGMAVYIYVSWEGNNRKLSQLFSGNFNPVI